MTPLAVALVHYPVCDRGGAVVTTAITNLDLHDLARSARAYGVDTLYVVHPIEAQRRLAERIREHWVEGSGKDRIPDRAAALGLLRVVAATADVYAALAPGGRAGVEVWTTAATAQLGATSTFCDARRRLAVRERPVVLTFGTGWGLAPELVSDADVRLEPIRGRAGDGWNHLSVRAACAIALDRLLG